MELTGAIQEALLCILCFDKGKKGSAYVKSLVPPQSFDKFFREIATIAVKYIEQYKKPPGDHTRDLVDTLKKRDPESKDIYERLYRSMLVTRKGINREYVLGDAIKFRRYQRCRSILQKGTESLNSNSENCVDEMEAILSSVTKPIDKIDIHSRGLLLNDPKQSLAFLDRADTDSFRTGIKEFDAIGACPLRGGSFLYLAGGNSGKTQFCTHIGKIGLLDRAKVLHISLEMDKQQLAARYMQSLFAITRREAQKLVTHHFDHDKGGRFTGTDKIVIKNRPSFKDSSIKSHLRNRITKVLGHKPPLIIESFPTGTLTCDHLRAYLDFLENAQSFIPDILIVDYPELMKLDAKNFRIDISRTHVELRGIVQERQCALVIPSQSSVDGDNAKRLSRKHMAESKDKYNTADIAIAYNQTEAEEQRGLARLESIKVRNEEKHTTVLISQSYAMGQYCLDSTRMSNIYMETIMNSKEE